MLKLTSLSKLESISWEGWVIRPRMKLSRASSSYISNGANWCLWSRSDLSLFPNRLKKLQRHILMYARIPSKGFYRIRWFIEDWNTYSIWPWTKLWPNLNAAVANTLAIEGFTVPSYCFWYPFSNGLSWLSSMYWLPKCMWLFNVTTINSRNKIISYHNYIIKLQT